jgi:phenylalanyl-tRNA synthetase beta subunit
VKFYPLDIYIPDNHKDIINLTIRFIIQSNQKTLLDKELSSLMEQITDDLVGKFVI